MVFYSICFPITIRQMWMCGTNKWISLTLTERRRRREVVSVRISLEFLVQEHSSCGRQVKVDNKLKNPPSRDKHRGKSAIPVISPVWQIKPKFAHGRADTCSHLGFTLQRLSQDNFPQIISLSSSDRPPRLGGVKISSLPTSSRAEIILIVP